MDIFLHSVTFSVVAQWVIGHGYWVIFLAMLIEGPIVTAAAAFAVALGYFNLLVIFGLSLAGDLVADIIYYAIGYWGRMTLVERFGQRAGLSKERLLRIGNLLHDNPWKTLLVLKLTPILPTPGLMLVGAAKMPLRKYIVICTLIILPKSLLFMIIGYYFGRAYDTIAQYINNGTYIIIALISIIALIDYLFRKYSARFARRIEKL